MSKLRLVFAKEGRAVYISHLDLMRTMQRAFTRAGLKLKYSEGFNPHAVISIALPLSVGVSSVCELMIFSMEDEMELSELPERLNSALPEGIRVLSVYECERKVKEIKWLKVSGDLKYDGKKIPDAEEVKLFFERDSIPAVRRTKRGESEEDLAPHIRDTEVYAAGENSLRMTALVSAQEPSVSPALLMSALERNRPELGPVHSAFSRVEMLDEDLNVFR